MGDINVRLDLVKLERFFYVVVIILLVVMIVKPGFRDGTIDFFDFSDAKITGAVVGTKDAAPAKETPESTPTTQTTPAKTTTTSENTKLETINPSCDDGIKNQDETNVDCGGVCSGFWYNNKCNPGPWRPVQIECELDEDCDEGYLCEDRKCIQSPFSDEIALDIRNIKWEIDEKDEDDEDDDTAKVTSFDIVITNDRAEDIKGPRLEIYIWDELNAEDYEYNIRQHTVPLPTIASGTTFTDTISGDDPYYLITIPFENIDLKKNLKVLLYDYKNNLLANVTTDFKPK